jgi:undecaprenyl-diphosphatase
MIEFITAFDTWVLETLYAARDPDLVQTFIVVSEFGRAWTVYGLAICIALVLIVRRHYAYAAGIAISVASSGIGILLLKGLIERARPPVEFQAYPEVWYSFPSAHAALSVALCGFLAYLAWQIIPTQIGRYIALFAATTIVLAVSFSRLYLGVHYFSDVASGVMLGALCMSLGIWYVRIIHRP